MDITSSGRNNILIVDDTLENIKVLGTMLMDEGFAVSVAQSGKEALDIIDAKSPNIILLDINMQEMDGIETCRRIKSDPSRSSIPVIFLTAYTNIEYKKKAFAAGGVDYITKPFQREEVLARVKTHLEIEAYKLYLEHEVSIRTKELQVANKNLEIEILKTKQAEETLLQSQRMETVGSLASGLAHDLNNILTAITGTVSIIEFKIKEDMEIDRKILSDYLKSINHACSRSSNLISQLLSISKKRESKFKPEDLNKVMDSVFSIIENTFDKSIIIDFVHYPQKAVSSVDFVQIEQVILNLCVNAVHSMTIMRPPESKKGGKLTVTLDKIITDSCFCDKYPGVKEGEYYVISVQDTGVGIKQEILGKIFNPFFTTKKDFMGTGLGLAICYRIISNHSGIIDVYSEQGRGSEFKIYLPALYQSEPEGEVNNIEKEIVRGFGKILVIDDEDVIRLTMYNVLEECGYDVILAGDGKTGIELYKSDFKEIKAVILDVNLPDISGTVVFEELKKINKDAKIIISSGFLYDDRIEKMLSEGANDKLLKPFTLSDVSKRLSEVLKDS